MNERWTFINVIEDVGLIAISFFLPQEITFHTILCFNSNRELLLRWASFAELFIKWVYKLLCDIGLKGDLLEWLSGLWGVVVLETNCSSRWRGTGISIAALKHFNERFLLLLMTMFKSQHIFQLLGDFLSSTHQKLSIFVIIFCGKEKPLIIANYRFISTQSTFFFLLSSVSLFAFLLYSSGCCCYFNDIRCASFWCVCKGDCDTEQKVVQKFNWQEGTDRFNRNIFQE